MAEKIPQNLQNHAKIDPPFHFFMVPVFAITLLLASWNLIRNPRLDSAWWVVFLAGALVAVLRIRLYALKVQDRVIRLEERLRLSLLLPEPFRSRIGELTESQLIALRFASDGEIPALVEKTLSNNLTKAGIKKEIVSWRPDYFRV